MSQPASFDTHEIAVTDLCVARGGVPVFSGVTFKAHAGQALLVRGANGVGKSTLLEAIAGVLRPEAGSIEITGKDQSVRDGTACHFIAHRPAIKPELTASANLEFWAKLYGDGEASFDIDAVLAAARLDHAADAPAGWLSSGQTRRLALCRLVVAPRPIWLLDEPSAALDAQGDRWVGAMIDAQLDRGGLVVAATHLDLPIADQGRVDLYDLEAVV